MKKIIIIGNGNWATTIAKLIAENILGHRKTTNKDKQIHDKNTPKQSEVSVDLVPDDSTAFETEMLMYVHEETYRGKKLTECINIDKTNPIYLPGIILPDNIKAVSDITAANSMDVIIICIPHEFISIISKIQPKHAAVAINLSKGFILENKELLMPSAYISKVLGIECCCLMGANIASEVAQQKLAEATVGYTNNEQKPWLQKLFNNNYFKTKLLRYNKGIEVCGGLKNIVSLAYGIVRGMDLGSNAEAMVFRRGVIEIKSFCELIGAEVPIYESCCIGDLLASCTNGRNYKCGVEMGKCTNLVCEVEKKMGGQKLQGPGTVKTVCEWLALQSIEVENFSLFFAIYEICFYDKSPAYLKDVLAK